MEFANHSPGGSSQHHGSSCPYLSQSQHRPVPQTESFHGHAFGWGLAGQSPASYHHQWSAPPPATLEIPPSSQLRVPPTSSLDPYQLLSGNLPPPPQQQQSQPSIFRDTDASYGTPGGMSSGHPASQAPPTGTRSFNPTHNSRLPGQGPAPPSHVPQSAPPLPHSLQSQEQTQPAAPSHPHPHSSQAPQHPPPQNPPTFAHTQPTQSVSRQPPSGNTFSSSSADTSSLLSQQHPQLQQQQQQQQQQQYQSSMSGPNPAASNSVPPQHVRPPQVDPSAQYRNVPGQAAREQRQQRQPQDSQSDRHQRPPNPNGTYPPMGAQSMNIPPHIPSLLNPNHLQHNYDHDHHGAYSENIPPIPANQRDLPRVAPPDAPPNFSDHRRRAPSSRPTRRSGPHAPPLRSERDRDIDDELSPASSPGSSIDHAISAAHVRHGANDRQLRAAQIFRGSVTSRKVASSTAIASLESVDVDSLSEAERSCVICYNDFGTETPEGVREAPLRLPKCKHVFGDHCIKKWFEESDSCPYCRTKVPSDTRFIADSRALMEFMRARGQPLPPELNSHITQEAILRLVASPGAAGFDIPGGTRRSPPYDSGENRRRMRPRHSVAMSSPRGDGPAGGGSRPLSLNAFPPSANHSPPSREHHPHAEYHPLRAQDREREWATTQIPHASARQSQARAPSNHYHPYSWEESPLVDPSGRLPMPAAGPLPPMPGFSALHTRSQIPLRRTAPGTQPVGPTQPVDLGTQRDASAHNLNPPSSGFNATETNAPSVDMDIPMSDRDSAP